MATVCFVVSELGLRCPTLSVVLIREINPSMKPASQDSYQGCMMDFQWDIITLYQSRLQELCIMDIFIRKALNNILALPILVIICVAQMTNPRFPQFYGKKHSRISRNPVALCLYSNFRLQAVNSPMTLNIKWLQRLGSQIQSCSLEFSGIRLASAVCDSYM